MATASVPRSLSAPYGRLPASWPLMVGFVGFPVWWVLGLGSFIWIGLASAMLFDLLVRGDVRVPRGFGIWLLFIAWMLASFLSLDSVVTGIVFAYRAALYLAATVFFIYIYATPSRRLPTDPGQPQRSRESRVEGAGRPSRWRCR